MGGEAEASLYQEAAPCREAGTEAAGPSLSPKTRGAGAWGASGGGAVGPPGTGMEPGLETLTVGFQDRQGSPSQRRSFWAEVAGGVGRASGQETGWEGGRRAWGALGLDAAALREAGTRVPASVPTSRRSYLVSQSSGHCPLWVLAAGLSLPGPRVPGSPSLSLSPALSPLLPPSLPLPPASQQSSQGHPWAHKIKYLKDVGNVSRFLWQQENNSHFPDTLKESTFPLALRVANYF